MMKRGSWRRVWARFLVVVLGLGALSPAAASAFLDPADEGASLRPVVDQDYFPVLRSLIGSARKRIGLLHLTLHPTGWMSRAILKGLVRARLRGVEVLVVLEGHTAWAAEKNRLAARLLKRAGARVAFSSRSKLLHAKLVVIDDRAALVGSTNLSQNSMANNNETNLLLTSKRAARGLWAYVQGVARHPEADLTLRAPLEDGRSTVLTDRAFIDAATRVIDGAVARLRVSTYLFAVATGGPGTGVGKLFASLARAMARGVQVQLFLERSSFAEHVNLEAERSIAWLARRGAVAARFDSPTKITHCKLIIADPHRRGRERVVMGSTNWHRRGIDVAHQVNVITTDSRVVRAFDRYFERLYRGGSPVGACLD